jgi:hypothetical protein
MRPEVHCCPSCEGELLIRRYYCPRCELGIEGHFQRNPFSRLSREAQDFLMLFVKHAGNIRAVERELGLSYPTVRSRLNAVIRTLGFTEGPQWTADEIAAERMAILRELDEGKIPPREAEELLAALQHVAQKQEGGSAT